MFLFSYKARLNELTDISLKLKGAELACAEVDKNDLRGSE
jgi:hypothetical protein